MCYLPPLIHQVHSGFHPPPIRPRYQSHLFFWLLFGANLSLRLKCCSHESQHHKFWWITRYLIAASCCTAGPSESSQSVQSDTVRHGEAVWICNDTCQEALSVLQSEVMWERWDRIRLAREGKKRARACEWAGTTMRLYIHSHVSAVTPLISTNWVWIHVKHVVITRVGHESAPRGAALLLPRLSDYHWNNTATQWLDHLPLDKTQGWPKYTRAALSPAWHLHHNWTHEYQLRVNTLEEKWLHPQI